MLKARTAESTVSPHVEEELADYNLGLLDAAHRQHVEAHLVECEACRARMHELEAVVEFLSQSPLTNQRVWQRVQGELGGPGRFAHFTAALSELFDIEPAAVQALVARIDDPDAWLPGPAAGVELIPVKAGPKCGEAFTVLLRVQPGAEFPHHHHGGEERVLLLQGGYRDSSSGKEFWRGEIDERAQGTSHSFQALDELPCLCAAVTFGEEG